MEKLNKYEKIFMTHCLGIGSVFLGEQVALVSKKAFDNLKYIESLSAESKIYYPKFFSRDNNARLTYRNEIAQTENVLDDIFVLDIIRQEMRNDDPRIQRIVSE